MKMNDALNELKELSESNSLSENAKQSCKVGVEVLGKYIGAYRNNIEDELRTEIEEKIDEAYAVVRKNYNIVDGDEIDIGDDMIVQDDEEEIVKIFTNMLINGMENG